MNLRDLHGDPDLLTLQEDAEEREELLERERRHGPVNEDPSVEAEFKQRRAA